MPKVSVIIPIYKTEKYLPTCLNSIIGQSYKDLEIICINDGSPDKSKEILKKFQKQDKRIKVINQANKGLSAARNAGIEKATGDYLFFVDSDDSLHPQAIEILTGIAERTKAPITVSNHLIKLSEKKKFTKYPDCNAIKYKIHSNPVHDVLRQKRFIACSKLFKRKLFKNWRFIEGIRFEDWPLITCIFSEIPFFVSINTPLYLYNDMNVSITRSDFSVKKIQDYMTGIRFVYQYYQKKNKIKYWEEVRKIRIRQSVKMVLSKVYHSYADHPELVDEFFRNLEKLLSDKIIKLYDFSPKGLYRLIRLKLYKKK